MTKLYSYVVEHDNGFAPNPFGRYCTLVKCKYGFLGFRNIVELAEVGDWIAGTGGVSEKSANRHGTLIYAMRVDEKLALGAYYKDKRFAKRSDAEHDGLSLKGHFALISRHFFYFGKNVREISEIPSVNLRHPKSNRRHAFEKKGPGFRSDFTEDFIEDFAKWLNANYKIGIHGPPCNPDSELPMPTCPSEVRRKRCPK